MINFGIDLGTTNSAIAAFDKGQVVVFRNPITLKDTLPSVVALRNDRLLVGDKAREFILRAPQQVAAGFKRKMGTSETYTLADQRLTPIELSAYVLRELRQFIHTGEQPRGAVITIPASFDTIQSNATKEAGKLAGFGQVLLLQEPIAASLAYANQDEADRFETGQWLVYDLGGGTFDAALVRIEDGEMRVLDHEGDNFLGGTDFDQALVERLVIPHLEAVGTFHDLEQQMKRASGRHNALYHTLLMKAEDAKIQLTARDEAEIECAVTDDAGAILDIVLTITRAQFEEVLAPFVDQTVHIVQDMLARHHLRGSDLNFVLMVGGSTYIPYVRHTVGQRIGVAINTRIDPTTAVAVGAAYYAGTKALHLPQEGPADTPQQQALLHIRTAYQKATQELSEYFTAAVEGPYEGLFYRITRSDGGYDSGLRPLGARIHEQLPLLPNSFNKFVLQVFDAGQQAVAVDVPEIAITQGRYAVLGQPLPHDICIEIDDVENGTTLLQVIFEKGTLLPARRTLVKQASRTIARGEAAHLTISVLEGPGTALPAANQTIGFIRIAGKDLTRDLVRGSDIEITLELSESRDLHISAYLMMTDQEFAEVFAPSVRKVSVGRLVEELHMLADHIRREIVEAEDQDNYESAQRLVDLEYEMLELADQAGRLGEDDVTDDKFQLEDRKRKIAQRVDALTRDKFIIKVKNEYFEAKRNIEFVLENYSPTPEKQQAYDKLIEGEKATLSTNSSLKINELIEQMNRLNWQIRWQSGRYLRELFTGLIYGRFGPLAPADQAQALIGRGQQALETGNDDQLRVVINQLFELLPPTRKPSVRFGGTGIA
ncbi:MAG: hypothetical protein OHK0039_33710 [Bacteroidia bacterium]